MIKGLLRAILQVVQDQKTTDLDFNNLIIPLLNGAHGWIEAVTGVGFPFVVVLG